MKKNPEKIKKRIISIVALLLVVLMFIGILTSCGKPQYTEKVKDVLSIQEGDYELLIDLSDTESKSTENAKLLLSGNLKINDNNIYLTSNISLDIGGTDNYVDFTDIIFNEKGLYFNVGKLIKGLKTVLNNDYFTQILNNLKIEENQYVFITYNEIKENCNLNKKDITTVARAFNDTFAKDLDNFIANTNMISYEEDAVIVKLDKENAEKIIIKLREYINENFESTFDKFLSKIEDIESEDIKIKIKELKEKILKYSDKDLKEYEKNYEKKLEEQKVNDFAFTSKVKCDNKKGNISFIANTNINDAKTSLNINYTINKAKIEQNAFNSPKNAINYETLQKKFDN